MGVEKVQREDYHSGASDTQDLIHCIPVIALAETTVHSPLRLRFMLTAAGEAQEHNYSGVFMAQGSNVSTLVVQIRSKETQERLIPRVLCFWDWSQ